MSITDLHTKVLRSLTYLLIAASSLWVSITQAAPSVAPYMAQPPILDEAAPPLVMFAMSNDHQLYIKAYTDYTDLNGDGGIDTTYNDAFDYYGYFSSNWCYGYDSGSFQPVQQAGGSHGHSCGSGASGRWSGNFLNWVSMTRMDIVRRVLFGGKRFADPVTGNVVLERVILPTDVHAFAKVYRGNDFDQFTPYSPASSSAISFCNVTPVDSGLSKDVDTATNPPKIIAAAGAFPSWAAREVTQCSIGEEADNFRPGKADIEGKLNARVQVCVQGKDAGDIGRCKQYPNGSYKPVGILQKFGESRELRFGLISGSYEKNISGGALRRNIGYIAGNTGSQVDDNEVDLHTGEFVNQGLQSSGSTTYPGIINTLSRFRISQYDFGNRVYNDCSTPGISVSEFKSSSASGKQCRDWGNPLAEIYAEALRYLAGNTTPAFAADDSPFIAALPTVDWTDPYDSDERCANCAIIVLSTGLSSFDADEFASGISGLASQTALDGKTNEIGDREGISGSQYFVGATGSENNGRCTAKTVSSLADVRGLCPELPQQEGSYHIAGLAYHARTNDLRPDGAATGLDGDQTVQTFAIQLAETVPQFTIPFATGSIQFMPACVAHDGSNAERQCSLVDVEVINPLTNSSGAIQVTWEDSSWGNDYDLDATQRIDYCVGDACGLKAGQLKMTVSAVRKVAGHTIEFGYMISGTTNDGQHIVMTLAGGDFDSPDDSDAPDPEADTFTVGGSTTETLKNPLWYAAKYGGFNDIDGDGTPLYNGSSTDKREWDVRDLNGNYVVGGDGYPDNFFPISNPANLEQRLNKIFQGISERITSGTAAAVVANSGTGLGAIYQAYYNPRFVDDDGQSISWGGVLHGLFVDEYGRLREDRGVKGVMEITTTDFVIELFTDYTESVPVVKYRRYTDNNESNDDGKDLSLVDGAPRLLADIDSIWNARDVLALISDAEIVEQRDVGAGGEFVGSQNRRFIFTFLDRLATGTPGVVDAGEVVPFTSANFETTATDPNFRYLGLADPAQAPDLVNYIRGLEGLAGFRNRTVDFTNDGTENPQPWRLGDMVHSSPAVVAAPSERYDIEQGDETYAVFKRQYERRRQMIYVGANDGMLHAFNGGVWDTASKSYKTRAWDSAAQSFAGASHGLGQELWAYVPMNLLPHLQWLADPDYPHVYYVDGAPLVFDANIFPDDAIHPGGWGTVLVVGMRLGGGDFPLDLDGDGVSETTTRSAFVILDITDPERPPTLIAELTDADLGYTTSMPTLVKRREPTALGSFATPVANEWHLVFGSGPTALGTATSSQNAKIYAYDLVNRILVQPGVAIAEANSFFGDFVTADWSGDYIDDVVYVGTIEGTEGSPSGRMKRIVLNSADTSMGLASPTISTLLTADKPIVSRPTIQRNLFTGDRWVIFGTGRLFTSADNGSTAQQASSGVLEPAAGYGSTVAESALADITDVVVDTAGRVYDGSTSPPGTLTINSTAVSTFTELQEAIRNTGGWKRDFSGTPGVAAERNLSEAVMIGSSVVFTTYVPSGDACDATGNGGLYALNFSTGTASPFNPLGDTSQVTIDGNVVTLVSSSIDLGQGLPSAPRAINNKLFIGDSQGEILTQDINVDPGKTGRQSWRYVEIPFQ